MSSPLGYSLCRWEQHSLKVFSHIVLLNELNPVLKCTKNWTNRKGTPLVLYSHYQFIWKRTLSGLYHGLITNQTQTTLSSEGSEFSWSIDICAKSAESPLWVRLDSWKGLSVKTPSMITAKLKQTAQAGIAGCKFRCDRRIWKSMQLHYIN